MKNFKLLETKTTKELFQILKKVEEAEKNLRDIETMINKGQEEKSAWFRDAKVDLDDLGYMIETIASERDGTPTEKLGDPYDPQNPNGFFYK